MRQPDVKHFKVSRNKEEEAEEAEEAEEEGEV
jgi:hypothetical protein